MIRDRCWLFALAVSVFIGMGVAPRVSAQDTGLFQRVEIPSSFHPVGSGARALGMGGAFIAVADDATAASWNPGGLIQLQRPEVSVVGDYLHRIEALDFGAHPRANSSQSVYKADINYLSLSYPFHLWRRNMVVSLNYQHLYDMTRQWRFPLSWEQNTDFIRQQVESRQTGDLSALGLAYCIQIRPRLSLGLTVNLWDDAIGDNGWENRTFQWGRGRIQGAEFQLYSEKTDRYTFSGWNMNLGLWWELSPGLTLGAVVKTPFEADIRHYSASQRIIAYEDPAFADNKTTQVRQQDESLTMPLSYGLGLAWRFSDAFCLSADIYRTQWDDFELQDAGGRKISPLTGQDMAKSDIRPTHQVRMGAEYLIIGPSYVVPLRCGLFYDPLPAPGGSEPVYGFSLGTGLVYSRFSWDIAYGFRYGEQVRPDILESLDFSQDIAEHRVYSALIFYF